MNARKQLFALQWSQLKHDETYHKEVVIMPLAERVKHMALHNAKYTGYFFDAVERGDEMRTEQVLTDAFIITLATANTLNQDLGAELGVIAEAVDSLSVLGANLARSVGRSDADRHWLVREFARGNGVLAKACESWDHMEDMPFRPLMRDSNTALLKVLLAETASRKIDLASRYTARIQQVETRSIFNRMYREDAKTGV